MFALLTKLPAWIYMLTVLVIAVILMRGTGTTTTAVGAVAYDLTVAMVLLLVTVMPYAAVVFAALGAMHLVHDQGKAAALGISAGVLGLIALLWHLGAGPWVLAHWLVRPA